MKIRVLVVDDDEDLLYLATKFFEKEDPAFELVGASTDQEALRKLEEEEFDAIVCDHYLGPHSMSGLDLLEWVREGNPNIQFFILTGRSQEAVAIRALNLGADYYLKKGTDEVRELFSQIAVRIKSEVEQKRTEEALETAYASLETRVVERTLELEKMNQRLIHEIDERQKVENSLLLQQELGNALCQIGNLTDALDTILKTAVQLEGVDSGSIYLVDNQTGKFGFSSSLGLSAHFLGSFFKEEHEPSIDKPVYLSAADIQSSIITDQQYENLKSIAIIPIQSEGRTVAILNLVSHSHEEIPERVKRTLEAISIQIAAYMARNNAEKAIVEAKSEVEAISKLIDDMFLVINREFNLIFANRRALERLGLSSENLSKKQFHELYEDGKRKEIETNLQHALEGKVVTLDIALKINNRAQKATTRITKAIYDKEEVFYALVHETKSQ